MGTSELKSGLVMLGMVLFVGLFIFGCSLSETTDTTETTELTGEATKGPISDGTVSVYVLNNDGSRGDLLATATTASDGSYSVNLEEYTGAVAVVITGGNYIDEATGENVNLETGDELETLLAATEDGMTVAVTALTTIAASRASENAASGLAAAIDAANQEVADVFGLANPDLSGIIPSDLTESVAGDTDAEQVYGAVQSGLSQIAETNGLSSAEVLDLIANMAEDFEDGTFDGTDAAGNALSTTLSVAPADAIGGLETAIEAFLISPENGSGISLEDLDINIPNVPSI